MSPASAAATTLLLACGALSPDDLQAACLQTARPIALAGQVSLERRAGPPNYGESGQDSVRTVRLLRLSHPIDVCGEVRDGVAYPRAARVTEVQLVALDGRTARPGPWIGRGRLGRAEIGGDYRRIIFLLGD